MRTQPKLAFQSQVAILRRMKRTTPTCVGLLFAFNILIAADTFKLNESLQQKIKCAGPCAVTSTPKGSIILTADLMGSLAELDSSAILSFTFGRLAFSAPLSADPKFVPG